MSSTEPVVRATVPIKSILNCIPMSGLDMFPVVPYIYPDEISFIDFAYIIRTRIQTERRNSHAIYETHTKYLVGYWLTGFL